MNISTRHIAIGLLWLIGGSFVAGTLSAAGLDLALSLQFSPNLESIGFRGFFAIASLLLPPLAVLFALAPIWELCTEHDHLFEVILPLQLVGPGLIFGLACTAAYLLFRSVPLPGIVALSVVVTIPAFVALHFGALALLTQMRASCPPISGG